VKQKRHHLLFLIETEVRMGVLQWLRQSLDFVGLIQVDPVGRSGGLALLWTTGLDVMLQNYSQRHISATISLASSNFSWTFTGFYGNPDTKLQEESWRLISHLGFLSRPAWLCIGDFNEIVDQSEKVGGAVRREIQLDRFRITLLDCNLGDLGYYGTRYTWSNKRDAGEFIKERFDRTVATTSWSLQFLNASVEVLPVCNSDHKTLWLKFDKACVVSARLFCCEAKWNIDEERSSIVQEAWAYSGEAGRTSLGEVMRKISRC